MVVVYVAFPSQVDRRYMEQLALSALVDICRNGVLDASRAALRLKHLTEEQANAIMTNEDGSQDGENLLKDAILTREAVDVAKLDEAVRQDLITADVQIAPAKALARGEFEQYLCAFRKDGNLVPFLCSARHAHPRLFAVTAIQRRGELFESGGFCGRIPVH